MSANVLDAAINESLTGTPWWENGQVGGSDGTSAIISAKRITGDETADEIITMMGWDWTPEITRLQNPISMKTVDAYQIYRSDNGDDIATILSERNIQVPPAPRKIVEFMQAVREKVAAKWGSAGMTTSAKLWAQLGLGDQKDFGDGDIAENRLMMGYDYKTRRGRLKGCCTNIVCENTLQYSLSEKSRTDIDFGGLDDKALDSIYNKLGMASDKYTNVINKFSTLQSRKVDLQDGKEIITFAHILDTPGLLEKIVSLHNQADEQEQMVRDLIKGHNSRRTMELGAIGSQVLKAIVGGIGQEMPARRDNWYGAVQGVIYYVDHVAGRNEDSRIESGYFGARTELKEQALEAALVVSSVANQPAQSHTVKSKRR